MNEKIGGEISPEISQKKAEAEKGEFDFVFKHAGWENRIKMEAGEMEALEKEFGMRKVDCSLCNLNGVRTRYDCPYCQTKGYYEIMGEGDLVESFDAEKKKRYQKYLDIQEQLEGGFKLANAN